jgi:Effector-associated domain 4
MTNITLSAASRDRLEIFIANLLDYVNHRFETTEALHQILQNEIEFNWTDIDEARPKLIVVSTLELLLEFTANKYADRANENLKHDLYVLRDKLKILQDSRAKTQGNPKWHFVLTLWDRTSNDKNLTEFRQLWEFTKNDKPEPSPPKNPEPANDKSAEDNKNPPSQAASCIVNNGNFLPNNNGTINFNNTTPHAIEQTKEILKMDVLNNIQNMDARLDLICEALTPDFFLNQSTAKFKLK